MRVNGREAFCQPALLFPIYKVTALGLITTHASQTWNPWFPPETLTWIHLEERKATDVVVWMQLPRSLCQWLNPRVLVFEDLNLRAPFHERIYAGYKRIYRNCLTPEMPTSVKTQQKDLHQMSEPWFQSHQPLQLRKHVLCFTHDLSGKWSLWTQTRLRLLTLLRNVPLTLEVLLSSFLPQTRENAVSII